MCIQFSVMVMRKFRVTINIWELGLSVGWKKGKGVLRSAVRYELSFCATCSTLGSMDCGLLYGQAAV